jgi:hypothetical protein
MNPYITETAHAVKTLLTGIHEETQELQRREKDLGEAEARFKLSQWDFQTSDLNDDFSEAHVMHAFQQMAKAHGEKNVLAPEVARLQALVGTRQASISALCGALLPIGKQGISLVHGGKSNAPTGRMIGSQSLRDIIWEGRNQSLHHEEGAFRQPVRDVFAALEAERGPQFSLSNHQGQNLSKAIVTILGWSNYEAYEADMRTLLP